MKMVSGELLEERAVYKKEVVLWVTGYREWNARIRKHTGQGLSMTGP